jgi:hypothetical protein
VPRPPLAALPPPAMAPASLRSPPQMPQVRTDTDILRLRGGGGGAWGRRGDGLSAAIIAKAEAGPNRAAPASMDLALWSTELAQGGGGSDGRPHPAPRERAMRSVATSALSRVRMP